MPGKRKSEEMVGMTEKKPRAKAKAKAKGKKQQQQQQHSADLRASFQTASSNSSQASCKTPQDPADVDRSHQSLFLTYMKNTTQGKDQVAANQASRILSDYKAMTNEQKRVLVTNFFKGGARKAGLSSVYRQMMKTESEPIEKLWQGYATPDMVLDFFKVHVPPTPNKGITQTCCHGLLYGLLFW